MSNKIFMYEFKCDQMTNIFKIWLFMYSNEKLPNRIKSLPNTNYTLRKITKYFWNFANSSHTDVNKREREREREREGGMKKWMLGEQEVRKC